ncbi:type III PLP-dependent enzyme domain-containing protein [Nocardia fluminea]|uniref:Diaminopimelate decarboxylase n=1 Tax=Nocardia fluminea TaxID=134984 RepID=A0A2N3WVY0_9NOCA|nr:Y4yA family PLP-dependent enzyme [Nocardia fluminea]PKV98031.1 diaminopimelate decarboxylase [Nocardia fluminea]
MDLTQTPLPLPAKEPGWVNRIQSDPHVLGDIADAMGGSPFHVLCPDQFAINLASFVDAMVTAGVEGKVYFGKKANKAACWPRVCAEANAGVDVASAPEMIDAIANGVRGEDIVVTGPAKSTDLLWLATRHRCLIAIDALDELEHVIAIAEANGPADPVRILLRVLPPANPNSRFGFDEAELATAIERCVGHRAHLRMEGFSFHLTGYSVAPRAWQAADLIDRCVAARALGLVADSVSIGGGFAVDYVDEDSWRAFLSDYQDSWFHTRKTFTEFYPYHASPAGAEMLTAILDSSVASDHADLAAKFAQTGTRLLIEPGRALLDGCGFTAFPVLGFKHRPDYGFITASGLSLSLSEQWFASEYLPDPTLWPVQLDGTPTSACVGGSSCLESDMLSWRKIRFDQTPGVGDLLIYPNTAGYQMDSNESEFHQLPLPPKVVVTANPTDRIRWRLDSAGIRSRKAIDHRG